MAGLSQRPLASSSETFFSRSRSAIAEASRRYQVSAAFAAIVAWAHQTSSSKADFVAASSVVSMSSMGLFAPIGEVT